MAWDGDEPKARPAAGAAPPRQPGWRALPGGGAKDAAANVRLRREFKGVTAGDLLADEQLLARLPGRAGPASTAVRRGDPEGAGSARASACQQPAAAPGGRVVPGPGYHRSRRVELVRFLVFVLAASILTLLLWMFG